MYACSSIIQFSWIIKLYFSIKSDWVSCCSWDFLASHQTCRQNCPNSLCRSLSLRLFPAIFQSQFFCCTGPLVSDHPSYLDQSATKKLSRTGWVLTTLTTLPEGWAIDSCSFEEGQRLCFCSHAFLFSKEIKGRNSELISSLGPWSIQENARCCAEMIC